MKLLSLCIPMILMASMNLPGQDGIELMIVTGGHGFDRDAFFSMFDQMPGVKYDEVEQPIANEIIEHDLAAEYDLIVFYDMYDQISDEQKRAYLQLMEIKKPMLFLHHALVSYQDWPAFKQIVGGRYHTLDSSRSSFYQHDDTIQIKIATTHPITNGISDFTLIDETYGNCEILPHVVPLITTDHPRSLPVLGWINRYMDHSVIYLQGGHGPTAFEDDNFHKILERSINWLARER